MIGYLKGNVIYVSENLVILEVNGVGYELTVSASALDRLQKEKLGEVYTYLAVNEQGVNLYGFNSLEEKQMFLKLITVSGVGPKMGISILSQVSLSALAFMIGTSDIKGLSKVKGLGKKTAERIIVELREIMQESSVSNDSSMPQQSQPMSQFEEDACLALMTLGFTKTESLSAVKEALKQNLNSVEEVITTAIKNLGK